MKSMEEWYLMWRKYRIGQRHDIGFCTGNISFYANIFFTLSWSLNFALQRSQNQPPNNEKYKNNLLSHKWWKAFFCTQFDAFSIQRLLRRIYRLRVWRILNITCTILSHNSYFMNGLLYDKNLSEKQLECIYLDKTREKWGNKKQGKYRFLKIKIWNKVEKK